MLGSAPQPERAAQLSARAIARRIIIASQKSVTTNKIERFATLVWLRVLTPLSANRKSAGAFCGPGVLSRAGTRQRVEVARGSEICNLLSPMLSPSEFADNLAPAIFS